MVTDCEMRQDYEDEADQEVFCQNYTEETVEFDEVVNLLTQVLLGDEFIQLQENFMRKYCDNFNECDENSLEQMDVFRLYNETVENFVIDKIQNENPSFVLATFLDQIAEHKEELDDAVFDILVQISDYTQFKNSVLEFKAHCANSIEDKHFHTEDILKIVSIRKSM